MLGHLKNLKGTGAKYLPGIKKWSNLGETLLLKTVVTVVGVFASCLHYSTAVPHISSTHDKKQQHQPFYQTQSSLRMGTSLLFLFLSLTLAYTKFLKNFRAEEPWKIISLPTLYSQFLCVSIRKLMSRNGKKARLSVSQHASACWT